MRYKQKTYEGGYDTSSEDLDDLSTETLETQVEQSEFVNQIQGLVAILTPEQQKLVDLKFYQKLNDTDISRVLGISRQSVQDRFKVIFKHLQKSFQK